jgi:hypothetical protein
MGKSKEFEESKCSFKKRSEEELREIAKKGGKRSGEVRSRKKEVEAFLKQWGVTDDITKEELSRIFERVERHMAMLPEDELKRMQADKSHPVFMNIIAKGLFGKDGYKNMRRALGLDDSVEVTADNNLTIKFID